VVEAEKSRYPGCIQYREAALMSRKGWPDAPDLDSFCLICKWSVTLAKIWEVMAADPFYPYLSGPSPLHKALAHLLPSFVVGAGESWIAIPGKVHMKILIGYDGSVDADGAIHDLRLAGLPAKANAVVITFATPWVPFGAEGMVPPAFSISTRANARVPA
jgi:hypothetical protein